MRWGRTKQTHIHSHTKTDTGGQRAVLIVGILLCTLCFTIPFPVSPSDMAASPADARQVIEAFCRDHVFLSDALGIDEYFSADAVSAGAFEEKSEAGYRDFVNSPRWTFSAYLKEALRRIFIGDET